MKLLRLPLAQQIARLMLGAAVVAVIVPAPLSAALAAGSPKIGPPTGAGRITVGIQPSGPHKPDSRSFLSFSADPGAVATDYVAVTNYGIASVKATMYAVNGHTSPDGAFALDAGSSNVTDVGRWVTVSTPKITLPARGQKIVKLTLRVPVNATPGDHAGGVALSITLPGKDAKGRNVLLEQRVAARVYVRVSGELKPLLQITKLKAKYHGTNSPFKSGRVDVHYVVTNFGNVIVGAHQKLDVTGLGSSNTLQLPDLPDLTPGASLDLSASIAQVLPVGSLKARITVSNFHKEGSNTPLMPTSSRSVRFFALPIPLLIWLGGFLVIGILFFLLVRRLATTKTAGRRRKRGDAPAKPRQAVA